MANPASAPKGELVTRERMSAILGIAKTTLDEWVRRGCPVHRPSARKGIPSQYDTAAVLDWRQADLGGESTDGIKAEFEKARLYRAQANRAERIERREGGELVLAIEVRAFREAENVAIRDRIRSVPAAVADRIIDEVAKGGKAPQVAAIILAELDEALEQIADAEVIFADEQPDDNDPAADAAPGPYDDPVDGEDGAESGEGEP